MQRASRKVLEGKVLSNKMNKTVVVEVQSRIHHPRYNKLVTVRKKFYAHNENDAVQEGDTVTIMETRPLSKLKRWRVASLVNNREAV